MDVIGSAAVVVVVVFKIGDTAGTVDNIIITIMQMKQALKCWNGAVVPTSFETSPLDQGKQHMRNW